MEGSRCQKTRHTWSSSLSTITSRMPQKWNNMHKVQLNSSRGPWKSKRTRMGTRTISTLSGRTRESKGNEQERSGMEPPTRGGPGERRGLHIWGSSSLRGSPVGTAEEPHFLWEENTARVRGSRTEWDLYTGYCPQPCPPSLRGCPPLQTRAGYWDAGFGEQTQAEDCCGLWGDVLGGWAGERKSTHGNACGGSLNQHRTECCCWVMPKEEAHCSLSPLCWPLLTRHQEGLPLRWALLSPQPLASTMYFPHISDSCALGQP